MFESLQDGLSSALKSLRGKGKLTESNMRDSLRMVEQSLLEADVSYEAVKAFMNVLKLRLSMEKKGSRTEKRCEPHNAVCSRMWATPLESVGTVLNATPKVFSESLRLI